MDYLTPGIRRVMCVQGLRHYIGLGASNHMTLFTTWYLGAYIHTYLEPCNLGILEETNIGMAGWSMDGCYSGLLATCIPTGRYRLGIYQMLISRKVQHTVCCIKKTLEYNIHI